MQVLKGIVLEENKLQEVMLGLAAYAFKFMTYEESKNIFERAGIQEEKLAEVLVEILKKYQYPPIRFPRIRRFTIELAIWMMRDLKHIHIFKNLGLKNELENVLDTTSELECLSIFAGPVGLNRYRTSMQSLAETALSLLEDK